VKFVDTQKTNRALARLKKRVEDAQMKYVRCVVVAGWCRLLCQPRVFRQIKSGSEEDAEAYKNLEASIAEAEDDLKYIQWFPKSQRYMSLYPPEPRTAERQAKCVCVFVTPFG
jgi:hypothetical protein